MKLKEAVAAAVVIQKNFPSLEFTIEKVHNQEGEYQLILLSDYMSFSKDFSYKDTGRYYTTHSTYQLLMDLLNMFVPLGTINLHMQFREELSRQEKLP